MRQFKRLFVLALCLLMLAQSAALADAAQPKASDFKNGQPINLWAKITVDRLNYRTKAESQKNNVICRLDKDNTVFVLEKATDSGKTVWYKIRYYDTEGWIQSQNAALMTQAESANHALKTTDLELYGPDKRTGGSPVIVKPGTPTTPPVSPTHTPKPIDPGATTGVTNTGKLNFRKTPKSASNNVIQQLDLGVIVEILDQVSSDGKTWYHIRYNGVEGYVISKFIDVTTGPVPTPTDPGTIGSTSIRNALSTRAGYRLTWDAVTGATAYEVYYAPKGGAMMQAATVTGTSYTLTTLTAWQQYSAYVKPVRVSSYGTVQGAISGAFDFTATNLTINTNNGAGVALSWSSAGSGYAYNIYRATSYNGSYRQIDSTSALSYTDTGVSAGSTYYYKVRAFKRDTAGNPTFMHYSAANAGVTMATPRFTGITLTSSSGVTLTWSASQGSPVYEISYKNVNTGVTNTVTSQNTSCTLTSLTKGVPYLLNIRAYKAPATDVVLYTPNGGQVNCTPLAVPTMTGVTDNGSGLSLSFSTVTGAEGYYIYRSTTTSASGFAKIAEITRAQAGTGSTAAYVDSTAVIGQTYYYKVCAYVNCSGFTSGVITCLSSQSGYLSGSRTQPIQDPITYRALLVVEPTEVSGLYDASGNVLVSTRATDLSGMYNMISRLRMNDGTGNKVAYSSIIQLNGTTTSTVFSRIATLASQADDNDVTLFYFMGHGSPDGSIHFYNDQYITPTTLRQRLDTIPGRVIAIIGSCYSGQYTYGRNAEGEEDPSTIPSASGFTSSIISALSGGGTVQIPNFKEDGTFENYLTVPKYLVLTSAAYNQTGWSVFSYYTSGGVPTRIYEEGSYTHFVRAVYRAGGWEEIDDEGNKGDLWGSGSRSVTLQQVYTQVENHVGSQGSTSSSVQVYPVNSMFILFQR